ncbi:hypothetical protein BN11_650012 [Nostocoides australiense Ben110]|uniref:Uncharacterized protein n=1 Tax=Nostocoides australiense Ben110 TaxID=1193182 RepID=W6K4N8_9MICO|nr:hypothetical protein BN11_650012 [Tetrasphaera australiensis Ben110]
MRIFASGVDWAPEWVATECKVEGFASDDDGLPHLSIWDDCVWGHLLGGGIGQTRDGRGDRHPQRHPGDVQLPPQRGSGLRVACAARRPLRPPHDVSSLLRRSGTPRGPRPIGRFVTRPSRRRNPPHPQW